MATVSQWRITDGRRKAVPDTRSGDGKCCLPVTSSYEGCPASYWRLTVRTGGWQSELVAGRETVFSRFRWWYPALAKCCWCIGSLNYWRDSWWKLHVHGYMATAWQLFEQWRSSCSCTAAQSSSGLQAWIMPVSHLHCQHWRHMFMSTEDEVVTKDITNAEEQRRFKEDTRRKKALALLPAAAAPLAEYDSSDADGSVQMIIRQLQQKDNRYW